MSGDSCKTVELVVDLQENGIIRLASTGRIIARLIENKDVNFQNLAKLRNKTNLDEKA